MNERYAQDILKICQRYTQDIVKSQKHKSLSDSPTWIQEMLAHLINQRVESEVHFINMYEL